MPPRIRFTIATEIDLDSARPEEIKFMLSLLESKIKEAWLDEFIRSIKEYDTEKITNQFIRLEHLPDKTTKQEMNKE
jgi:hypothetical protein